MVNDWGEVGEKQHLCTLHGALPCCLPWKNILYIDICINILSFSLMCSQGTKGKFHVK